MSKLIRNSCVSLAGSLLMPAIALAQEAGPAAAPIAEDADPLSFLNLFLSPVWWAAVVLGGIVGYIVLQRFLNK